MNQEPKEQMPAAVAEALNLVQARFPDVTHVFFNAAGDWFFCDESFFGPSLDDAGVSQDVLERAARAAAADKGFPCCYNVARRTVPTSESEQVGGYVYRRGGKYLSVSTRDTHTGHHVDVSWVPSLLHAGVFGEWVPRDVAQHVGRADRLRVVVERKLTVVSE